jgi:hypothetical protein
VEGAAIACNRPLQVALMPELGGSTVIRRRCEGLWLCGAAKYVVHAATDDAFRHEVSAAAVDAAAVCFKADVRAAARRCPQALVINDSSEWIQWIQWQHAATAGARFFYSREIINPFVVDVVAFSPPVASIDDVWHRTGSGMAVVPCRFDRKPLLKLADYSDAWVLADAHVEFEFVP